MDIRKRLLEPVGIGAVACLLAFGVDATSAKAENLANNATMTIDYATQTLNVTGLGLDDKEIMVNFPAVSCNRDGEIIKIKEKEKDWNVFQVPKAENTGVRPIVKVDLSSLDPLKKNYIIVKSTKCRDAVLICIDPVVTKVKGSYDAEEKVANFVAGGEELAQDDFEYRTSYGYWEDYSEEVELERYEQQGSNLWFRPAPSEAERVVNPKSNGIIYGTEGKEYLEYDANGTFAGKEVKVKVAKLRTAPTVSKVDLDNRAYIVKPKTEYRFSINGDEEWTGASSKTSVSLEDELPYGYIYYPGQFEVRSEAKDASGKKVYASQSKIMIYEYPGLRTVNTLTPKGNSLLGFLPANEDTGKQELAVNKTTNTKGQVTGITLENISSSDYQVVVSNTEVDPLSIPTNKKLKPKTLKAGKILRLSNSKSVCPEGSYIYVRYASVKASSAWASDYVSLGKLTFGN